LYHFRIELAEGSQVNGAAKELPAQGAAHQNSNEHPFVGVLVLLDVLVQCIAQIIKSELRRPPHVLVKSKSVLEEQEPSCILRHNQRRELESTVVRSDSISCAMMTKMAREVVPPAPGMVTKLKERMLLRQASTPPTASSWRRSNGWKRVTSPVHPPAAVSPKKVRDQLETIGCIIVSFPH